MKSDANDCKFILLDYKLYKSIPIMQKANLSMVYVKYLKLFDESDYVSIQNFESVTRKKKKKFAK